METLEDYVEGTRENGFENANTTPSNVDADASDKWTSKATTCLISKYKKFRSVNGIKSFREMFERISLEMQKDGFCFSSQRCVNKWQVLERKYKSIISREHGKNPGKRRIYGQWEHRRVLDEIFNEERKHARLEENDDPQPSNGSVKVSPNSVCDPDSIPGNHEDPLPPLHEPSNAAINERGEETMIHRQTLTTIFEKFSEEMRKNFALAERNKERRHKEKMAVRREELELKKQFLKLKEQKMKLQKCQAIAAAQSFDLNMK